MNILALEFSSSRRSVAVRVRGGEASDVQMVETRAPLGERTVALRLVEDALRAAGVERRDVEKVVVGLGPGSFTGIRMAITIAQGWRLATGCAIEGVSSMDALAWEGWKAGWRGRVSLAMDAQRGAYYLADYELTEQGRSRVDALRVVARSVLMDGQARGWRVAGPDLGEGMTGAVELMPSASGVAVLSAEGARWEPGGELRPIVLRETSFVKAVAPRGGL